MSSTLHHGDDLLQLFANLLQDTVVAHHDERHPRELRILSLADRQAVDVVAARSEHTRHVGQHSGDVLHEGRENMAHSVGTPEVRETAHHNRNLSARQAAERLACHGPLRWAASLNRFD